MSSSYTHCLGCDISKDTIDITLADNQTKKVTRRLVCKNDVNGFRRIGIICKGKRVQIAMEATGNYHIQFTDYLQKHHFSYSVVNPLSIKRYCQMRLQRTKTDKADAHMIAMYCFEQKPPVFNELSNIQRELKSLNTTLKNFIKQRTQLRNLLHSQKLIVPYSLESIKEIEFMLKQITGKIQKLQVRVTQKAKTAYPTVYKQMNSIKGVGPRTATALISYMGDLRTFSSAKKMSSFVGITPALRQSGSSLNKTRGITKQGNAILRTYLYMAAISASKSNIACMQLYDRLLLKGKLKKTALIAVANKLLKQIFAVVKNETMFVNGYV